MLKGFCWGWNEYGQLDIYKYNDNLQDEQHEILDIKAGGGHTC